MTTRTLRKILFCAASAVMLFAMTAGQMFRPAHSSEVIAAAAQSQIEPSAAPAGTTSAVPVGDEFAEASDNETLDSADVERDANAPDDTVDDVNASPEAVRKYVPIPVPLPGGLDHVANGAGTRNTGSGTIRLRGVCPKAVAVRAQLYWGTIGSGPIPLFQRARINGRLVQGTLVGSSPQPNWGCQWFAAYVANVITHIAPGINGDYVISDLPTATKRGGDPWLCDSACPKSEGASLVVIFATSNAPTNARVFVNRRVATFAGAINIDNPLPVPLPAHRALKHTRIGADGQVGASNDSYGFATNERTFLGPVGGPLVQIKGPGSAFNQDSDWNGDDGTPLNQLWDTHTDSFAWSLYPSNYPNILPPGIGAYRVRYLANGDLICTVVNVLGVK
jgi:hypothetical protein